MKSETQIAKENVRRNLSNDRDDDEFTMNWLKTHLASCQRFLEFLERKMFPIKQKVIRDIRENKITDLRNAIKTYEDAGVK